MALPNMCALTGEETAAFAAEATILIRRRTLPNGNLAHFGEFKLAEDYAPLETVSLPQWMVDGIASERPTEG